MPYVYHIFNCVCIFCWLCVKVAKKAKAATVVHPWQWRDCIPGAINVPHKGNILFFEVLSL